MSHGTEPEGASQANAAPRGDPKKEAAIQREYWQRRCFEAISETFVLETVASADTVFEWTDRSRRLVADGRIAASARTWVINRARVHFGQSNTFMPPLDVWKTAFDTWLHFSELAEGIKPFRAAGESCCAFHELPSPEMMGTPQWSEFLGRLSDPQAFLAWVWALVSGAPCRQIAYLIGGGSDGKTTVINAMRTLIGRRASLEFSQQKILGANNFTLIQLYRKRLITIPDCTEQKLLSNSILRAITGREWLSAEIKNGGVLDFQLDAMALVSSNRSPKIDDTVAERSRLLPLVVEPIPYPERDPKVPERFEEELPGLLWRARIAFGERCTDGVTIRNNDRTAALIDGCVTESVAEMGELVDRFFVLDPRAKLTQRFLKEILAQLWNEKKVDQKEWENFAHFANAFFLQAERKGVQRTLIKMPRSRDPKRGWVGMAPRKSVGLRVADEEGTEWYAPPAVFLVENGTDDLVEFSVGEVGVSAQPH